MVCFTFGKCSPVVQAAETVTAEAGAGLVKVAFTAQGKMTSLVIDPSLLDPRKVQVTEDLTVGFFSLGPQRPLPRCDNRVCFSAENGCE